MEIVSLWINRKDMSHTKENGGWEMIRMYRCVIIVLMIAAIGFGVWYCINTTDEQRSIKDGTLVLYEKGDESDGTVLYIY